MNASSRVLAIAQGMMAVQHGVVSRKQLVDMGIPGKTVDSRVVRGHLSPVLSGQYMQTGSVLTHDGLLVAALLKAGSGSALIATTAASKWGFMKISDQVEVLACGFAPSERAKETVAGRMCAAVVQPHRLVDHPAEHLTHRDGFAITTVESTLCRLAGVLPERDFRTAFTEADRLSMIDDRRLLDCRSWIKGRPGAALFRELAEDRDPQVGRMRSQLEVLLHSLILRGGLPRPELNVWVEGYLADFVWRPQRLIVETDGYQFHRGREKFERDAEVRNRLRSRGWTVLVYTHRGITRRPEQVTREIRLALNA